jgi:hypothetical protein
VAQQRSHERAAILWYVFLARQLPKSQICIDMYFSSTAATARTRGCLIVRIPGTSAAEVPHVNQHALFQRSNDRANAGRRCCRYSRQVSSRNHVPQRVVFYGSSSRTNTRLACRGFRGERTSRVEVAPAGPSAPPTFSLLLLVVAALCVARCLRRSAQRLLRDAHSAHARHAAFLLCSCACGLVEVLARLAPRAARVLRAFIRLPAIVPLQACLPADLLTCSRAHARLSAP